MSDITAKTMVPGFKRLPQRAYLGGHTSRFGSRTHFQLATFSALMRTPAIPHFGVRKHVHCRLFKLNRDVVKISCTLCLTASAVVETLLLARPVTHGLDVSSQACDE